MKRFRTAALSALLALAAIPLAQAQTKLSLGYTALGEVANAYLAKEQGIFAKYGLDVEMKLIALNSTIPAALLSDSIQIGTATPTVLLQAIDSGLPLQAFAGISRVSHAQSTLGLVQREGLEVKTAKDFAGKKVGVPGLNALVHVMIRNWLIENGQDPAGVTFVEVPFPNHFDIIKSGGVDILGTAEPMLSRIIGAKAGSLAVDLSKTVPETEQTMVYSLTSDYAAKNPKVIQAFRAAVTEASALVKSNPDLARKAIAVYVKLPPEIIAKIPLPESDAALAPKQMAFWEQVMRKQKMLQSPVDAQKIVLP